MGFALAPLTWRGRALYGVLSLLVVVPPAVFAHGVWVNAAGIVLAITALAVDYMRVRGTRSRQAEAPR